MANLIGSIVDGAYTKTEASKAASGTGNTTSTSMSASKANSGYDQDMFLQLLVAEMQYQDPLEPTDNSNYVAQLASFTTIEAIQAVQADMQTIQANSLVGKFVLINADDGQVSGKVDYVTTDDDGNLLVSVGEKTYKYDLIDSVIDETYYNAALVSGTFMDTVAGLPALEELNLSDEKKIVEARELYNAMDSYTKGFVNGETMDKLVALEKRLAALKAEDSSTDNDSEESGE
ncbi:MAG: flagellar hook capping protein [Pseudobutyrivibrio sp.]|nr:flagellar hook capping protein [Pseudobutyrivibrio sp.]